MALARYKDLCVDVVDEAMMTPFWAQVLGLDVRVHDDGDAQLVGPTPQHGVWLNAVPEPHTVKQRVHLDVHALSVGDVAALGASVLPDWGPFAWTVMADPEGGELCVFERDEVPMYRLYEIGIDAVDAEAIGRWWAGVLGTEAVVDDDHDTSFAVPGAPFDGFVFGAVAEPKTIKNRIHWDVDVAPGGIEALAAAGASVLRRPDEQISWTVMADPEGNEFCAFVTGD